MIDAAPIAGADGEVDVQPSGDGQRIAVFGSHDVVHLVPERASGFSAHVAAASGFEVVCEDLTVDADVVSGERFLPRSLSPPFSDGDVTAVGSPVPVSAVGLPPSVHPVGSHRPSFSQIHLHSDVRNQERIVEHIGPDVHIEGFPDSLRCDGLGVGGGDDGICRWNERCSSGIRFLNLRIQIFRFRNLRAMHLLVPEMQLG